MSCKFIHHWHHQVHDWEAGRHDSVYIVENRGYDDGNKEFYEQLYLAVAKRIQEPFPSCNPSFYIVPGVGNVKTTVHVLLEAEVVPTSIVITLKMPISIEEAVSYVDSELSEVRAILDYARQARLITPEHRQAGCSLCVNTSNYLEWVGHNKYLNTYEYHGPTKWPIEDSKIMHTILPIIEAYNKWTCIVNTQGVSDLLCMEAERFGTNEKHI